MKMMFGVFALAAYRIVPGINTLSGLWLTIKRNSYAIDIVADTIRDDPEEIPSSIENIPFSKQIKINDLCFSYDGEHPVIQHLNITIFKGEKIGFKAPSGTGKTTLFHLLMGLYTPQKGNITVDNTNITPENISVWQKQLAYVSQEVFILDASLAENIALGTNLNSCRLLIFYNDLSCFFVQYGVKESGHYNGIKQYPGVSICFFYRVPVRRYPLRLTG